MKYKKKYFIQYFNKLHEKIWRRKGENYIVVERGIIDILYKKKY